MGVTKHGESPHRNRTSEYETWVQMKARCVNPRHCQYDRYGGRGIAVCRKWIKSYKAFLLDVGRKPSPNHTLDRIKNNKGYSPGNVRWATHVEQNRNKSDNRIVYVDRSPMCISEVIERFGLNRSTLVSRLRRGWSLEDSIRKPSKQTLEVGGRKRTLAEWSRITGISASLITYRLKAGWAPKDIISRPVRKVRR